MVKGTLLAFEYFKANPTEKFYTDPSGRQHYSPDGGKSLTKPPAGQSPKPKPKPKPKKKVSFDPKLTKTPTRDTQKRKKPKKIPANTKTPFKGTFLTDTENLNKLELTKLFETKDQGPLYPQMPDDMYQFTDRTTAEKFFIKKKDIQGTTFGAEGRNPDTSDLTFKRKYRRVEGGFERVK